MYVNNYFIILFCLFVVELITSFLYKAEGDRILLPTSIGINLIIAILWNVSKLHNILFILGSVVFGVFMCFLFMLVQVLLLSDKDKKILRR
jgi:hypothetical protein